MRIVLIAMLAAIAVAGCDNLPLIGSKYAAEVGYYQGEKQAWDIWGDFGSLDECRAAAIARFNSYNAQSPGRAFSWACLKKNRDGSYQSRHR